MKPALFHTRALQVIQTFPKPVRQTLGEAILDLQNGKMIGMPLSRPMPSVGAGIHELRVKDSAGIYRAFYFVKSIKGIIVFHAFEKRTQKTPKHEIELGLHRLREML